LSFPAIKTLSGTMWDKARFPQMQQVGFIPWQVSPVLFLVATDYSFAGVSVK
jgi:hypothetical protein